MDHGDLGLITLMTCPEKSQVNKVLASDIALNRKTVWI